MMLPRVDPLSREDREALKADAVWPDRTRRAELVAMGLARTRPVVPPGLEIPIVTADQWENPVERAALRRLEARRKVERAAAKVKRDQDAQARRAVWEALDAADARETRRRAEEAQREAAAREARARHRPGEPGGPLPATPPHEAIRSRLHQLGYLPGSWGGQPPTCMQPGGCAAKPMIRVAADVPGILWFETRCRWYLCDEHATAMLHAMQVDLAPIRLLWNGRWSPPSTHVLWDWALEVRARVKG